MSRPPGDDGASMWKRPAYLCQIVSELATCVLWGALTPKPATTGKLAALRKHSQAPGKVNGVVN